MSHPVLRALVQVIGPAEAQPYGDAIADHVELTIGAAPLLVRRGFYAGLATYDLGALPRYLRRARFLTGAKAERYFSSWEHSMVPLQAQFARAINQLMSLACYEQPALLARLNYHPGPWIEQVSRRRLEVYGDDVRRAAHALLAPDPLRPDVRTKVS